MSLQGGQRRQSPTNGVGVAGWWRLEGWLGVVDACPCVQSPLLLHGLCPRLAQAAHLLAHPL